MSEGRVLVVGLERALFQKMEPLLSRSLLQVDRVARGESGVLLATQALFDLLVVRHPLPDMSLGSFMNAVHEPGARCGATPILVLTDPSQLAEVRTFLPGGAKQALSVGEPDKFLQEVASRLLGVTPRVAVRIPVRLSIQMGDGTSRVACQSENLSEQGMLVRSPTLYPMGTRLQFEFTLPNERASIQGEAEVMRHSVPDVEQVQGVGLKVLFFKGDGAGRLRRFLDKQS